MHFYVDNACFIMQLTDLDDRQTSKRLRELAKFGMDEDQADDFCPVQEPADDNVPKSCAECKQFKTHRTYNALMVREGGERFIGCLNLHTCYCLAMPYHSFIDIAATFYSIRNAHG